MKIQVKIYAFLLSNLFCLGAYSQAGELDITFGVDGKVITNVGTFNDRGNTIAIQNDGKIVVAGQSYNGTISLFTILRYETNGSLDPTFGNEGVAFVSFGASGCVANSVAIQSDGKIVVGGHNNTDFAMARLNSDGTPDLSFNSTGLVTTSFGTSAFFETINAIIIQNDNKILAVGIRFSGNFDVAIARYNPDGTLDTSFDEDGKVVTSHPNGLNEYGNAVTLQNDGKIIVAGYISTGGTNDFQIIRYNSNGSLDTTFNYIGKVFTDFGTSHDIANSIKIQNDDKIVVAGETSNGVKSFFALARYNPNGSLDTSFDTDGKLSTVFGTSDAYGNSLYIQDDSKIIVAGSSNSNFALARYNNTGILDTSFGIDGKVTTDFNNQIENGLQMTLQTDGKIIVVGNSFNDAVTGFALARYNTSDFLKIETFDENNFSVYPNPANEVLNFQSVNNSQIENIIIYDVFGKKIIQENKSITSINIQDIQTGLYFLQISIDGKTYTSKFIKQ